VDSACKYGGDFVVLPLEKMLKPGKGDDVHVVIDHEENSQYGCLDIEFYKEDFELACKLAKMEEGLEPKGPIMIAIQDPDSGSPVVLTKRVMRNGEKHFLAIIFNAYFSVPDENRPGSFCLRMSGAVDPKKIFSERIMYSPGDNIVWEPEQLRMLELDP
jgi:hypothetical protein